ncbi:hypothetical protein ScFU97_15510 [Streptococcus canis]|nr:hypothetical protein ScFU93_06230 [Streptococcus canis]GFG48212.1 hypothetical protein ScFU97_15510 [Streptococcus canis]GMX36163.1 hypothetical protein SpKU43_12410 [Streptococcus canis]GMX39004.1 hypothetical protein ScKU71_02270 [Streptococcus canis]
MILEVKGEIGTRTDDGNRRYNIKEKKKKAAKAITRARCTEKLFALYVSLFILVTIFDEDYQFLPHR